MPKVDRIQTEQDKKEDAWFGIYWRPAAAIIYLMICIFDFMVVPTYMNLASEPLRDTIIAIMDLPPETQTIVLNHKLSAWEPLTLKGGGLFHVAFGAILGATVWTRGQQKISEVRHGNYDVPPHHQAPYQPPSYPPYHDPQGGSINSDVYGNQPGRGGRFDSPD